MQEVNITLRIVGIGKGRCATSVKEGEVDGVLVKFDGDPGAAFLSWKSLKEQVNYKAAMQAANGDLRKSREAADG
jgi:hypothetical protein